uniref:Salivary protein 15 Iric-2 n=1 Tax=Ixodes ricinus TaxID=34613 RepID=SP152_IXORI|nr:RecName: Full=Salivary protein 15 Iric-2; Short=Salp15 Iric-2; AltName: Full=Salp15-like; Flags: Precursor [Ixodes ricinus]ABU93614.1 Salp15 Iric-2 [Ixodes ricinus]
MESFVAMKVVCIVLLFVIAAEAASTGKNPVGDAPNGKKNNITFNFPPYVPNHHAFASSLWKLCEESTPKPEMKIVDSRTTYTRRINDLQVNFKDCTFLCKRRFDNVTLDLPKNTPCGPKNQTCENKDQCVPHIPGC